MSKKNCISYEKEVEIQRIVGWRPPVFHQASECYVSVTAFDPNIGKMHVKKFMLGRIKSKRQQKSYGMAMVKKLTEQLMNGWNPWLEIAQPMEYTSFDDVCDRYHEYVLKLAQDDDLREETLATYLSRLNMLRTWVKDKKVDLYYSYQFDRKIVGRFLDYIFVDRNNTMRTRNNYLSWTKHFCRYMLDRGYVSKDPTQGMTPMTRKKKGKNRDVIPDKTLQDIHDLLMEKNRHFLLACYILHYLFVRPREMSYLKIEDFSIKNKTLYLRGDFTKNRSDAVITLPDHVAKFMIELGIFNYPGNYYLFSTAFHPGTERCSEKRFREYWLEHVRKTLNLSSRYKFYSLKDTGITNMLRANTDVVSVRDQARHSSILITDIYTPKDIQKANELILGYNGIL